MNIFGGNTGHTYDAVQRHRKVAQQLIAPRPRNVGQGVLSIADALLSRAIEKKADRREGAMRDKFNDQFKGVAGGQNTAIADLYSNPMASDAQKKILGALMKKGVPGLSRGGTMKRGGMAVVGEAGPELVELPAGAEVSPYNDRFWLNEQQQHNPNWNPELDKMWQIENEQTPPASQPDLLDQEMEFMKEEMRESRFDDANSYRTADMSGMAPSGVGEQNQLHSAARSYQGFMKSLQDYESMVKDGGTTAWPGLRKDKLATAHRDLQMQMKELYNLGVLNGPDLELMEQILLNPTTIPANVADALDSVLPGNQDMEQRIPANINEVRRMMRNRTEPALQQLGISPDALMPQAAPDQDGWVTVNGVKIRAKQ